jgi:FkbM family methyltransferase
MTSTTAQLPSLRAAPIVSVVIPAHNAEATIAEQLEALAEQVDAPPFEVIVSLNCCTDRTAEVVLGFTDRLEHFRSVDSSDDRGASHARNIGIDHASGQYILFCDADDIVDSRWVVEMTRARDHADVVGGRLITYDPAGHGMGLLFPVRQSAGLPTARNRIRFAVSASLGCQRWVADSVRFDERYQHGSDDLVFCLRAQRAGARMGFAEAAVCNYRVRPNSRTVAKQLANYRRSEAQFVHQEEPDLDPGALRDIARLGRSVAGFARIRNRSDLVKRRVLLHAHVAYVREAQRLRRGTPTGPSSLTVAKASVAARIPPLKRRGPFARAIAEVGSVDPVVWFTVEPSLPVIGGLGFSGTSRLAAGYSKGLDLGGVLNLVATCVQPGDHVADIGAHFGLVSIAMAKRVGSAGSVIAVEANPHTHSILRSNADIHDSAGVVQTIHAAVADQVGHVDFYLHAGMSVYDGMAPTPNSLGSTKVKVRAITPSGLGLRNLSLLKIDVEGYELSILRAAADVLRENPACTLFVEFNPAALMRCGADPNQLLELLRRHGKVWVARSSLPTDVQEGGPGTIGQFLTSPPTVSAHWYGDLIVVPDSAPLHFHALMSSGAFDEVISAANA